MTKNKFSDKDIKTIRSVIDPENKFNDDQIDHFLFICETKKLDPRVRLIYAVPRLNRKTGKSDMTIQTSIDGFRLIAERTGRYSPGKPTHFIFDDHKNLTGATVFVKKMTNDGTWHEVSSTAFLCEFNPNTPNNKYPNKFWQKMPSVMIEKVAESKALRRAFPEDFSGIYTDDEMEQTSDDKSESAPPIPKKISQTDVDLLEQLIGNDVEYRKKIMLFMKNHLQIDKFIDLPVANFDFFITKARENANKEENSQAVGA